MFLPVIAVYISCGFLEIRLADGKYVWWVLHLKPWFSPANYELPVDVSLKPIWHTPDTQCTLRTLLFWAQTESSSAQLVTPRLPCFQGGPATSRPAAPRDLAGEVEVEVEVVSTGLQGLQGSKSRSRSPKNELRGVGHLGWLEAVAGGTPMSLLKTWRPSCACLGRKPSTCWWSR